MNVLRFMHVNATYVYQYMCVTVCDILEFLSKKNKWKMCDTNCEHWKKRMKGTKKGYIYSSFQELFFGKFTNLTRTQKLF